MTRNIRSFVALPALFLASLGAGAHEAAPAREPLVFPRVVTFHLERYPEMEIVDLYKLVFQAAMGSEHAAPSRDTAAEWLERELSQLGPAPEEPTTEPLSPAGELSRVNLRKYLAEGGDVEELLGAFLATANRFEASEERLREYWGTVEVMAESGEISFAARDLKEFFAEMAERGFPAVRHSDTYRNRYQPAYRVVLLELLGSQAVPSSGR